MASIEQNNRILALEEKVALLEAAVAALLKAHNAPALPQPNRFASILGLKASSS